MQQNSYVYNSTYSNVNLTKLYHSTLNHKKLTKLYHSNVHAVF